MENIFESQFFSIILCIFTYIFGMYVHRTTKSPLANPLLISIVLTILSLRALGISFEQFNKGASFITLFLAPSTASLAISIYRKWDTLKKHYLPIIAGTVIGSIASMGSVLLFCKLFGLNDELTATLLPKSVTTPIAMEISLSHGGIPAVTVAIVIFTGILGAIFAPIMIKLFRIKDPIAQGVAIGTCSHAVGTSKALELGDVQGAMSGIAIGMAGIATVIIAIFI